MTKTEYREYLASPHWQRIRRKKLSLHAECQRCCIPRWWANSRDEHDFDVHHRTYDNLGHEKLEDLEVLCHRCHQFEHEVGPAQYCNRCDAPLYDPATKGRLSICQDCSKTHKVVRFAESPYVGLFGLPDGKSPDELVLVEVTR